MLAPASTASVGGRPRAALSDPLLLPGAWEAGREGTDEPAGLALSGLAEVEGALLGAGTDSLEPAEEREDAAARRARGACSQ